MGNQSGRVPTTTVVVDDNSTEFRYLHHTPRISINKAHMDAILCVLELRDETLLTSSFDKTIRRWRTADGSLISTFKGHTSLVSVALEVDDKTIASGSGDWTIRVWDKETTTCLRKIDAHRGSLIALIPVYFDNVDSRRTERVYLSMSCASEVKLWRLERDEKDFGTCVGSPKLFSYDPWVGNYLVKLQTMKCGRKLVAGSYDGLLRLWNVTGHHCEELKFTCELEKKVHKMSFVLTEITSKNGWVALSTTDWTIEIWNTNTGCRVMTLEGHTDLLLNVIQLSNGLLMSSSKDKTIRLWDIEEGDVCCRVVDCCATTLPVTLMVELHNRSLLTIARSSTRGDIEIRTMRPWHQKTLVGLCCAAVQDMLNRGDLLYSNIHRILPFEVMERLRQ